MRIHSSVRILMVLGVIVLLFALLPIIVFWSDLAGFGPDGITPSPAAPMAKLKSSDALTTFIGSCGNVIMVCSFKAERSLTIYAECDCASRRIILNVSTTRKMLSGVMNMPGDFPKLALTTH